MVRCLAMKVGNDEIGAGDCCAGDDPEHAIADTVRHREMELSCLIGSARPVPFLERRVSLAVVNQVKHAF